MMTPTAAVCDRTMTREEWAALHRKARNRIRRGRDAMGLPSDGSCKSVFNLGKVAVLKNHHDDREPLWNPPSASFMTAHEEAWVYRMLPKATRPWTVPLRDGWTLQEGCREAMVHGRVPGKYVRALKDLGIADIDPIFNMGHSTRDGGPRCFDWGCLARRDDFAWPATGRPRSSGPGDVGALERRVRIKRRVEESRRNLREACV